MLEDAVRELLSTYHELNGSVVDELHEPPTPLEFMKFVHKGRPFVVRGGVSDWPAMQWTIEYLKERMGETTIQVAVTPEGSVASFDQRLKVESLITGSCDADCQSNADAVVRTSDDGSTYFVKPMEVDEPFSDFIDYVRNQEMSEGRMKTTGNVKYSQAREED